MTNRERILAVLNYKNYDRLPLLHFGFWRETLAKWADEGHITCEESKNWADGNTVDDILSRKLGFDCTWACCFSPDYCIRPRFERKIIQEIPGGSRQVQNEYGVIILESDDAVSIPTEIDHLFKGRSEWEKFFKDRFIFSEARIKDAWIKTGNKVVPFNDGIEFLKKGKRDFLYGLFCGSLFGRLRDIIGVVGISYLYIDDEALFDEVINTNAELCYQCVKSTLETDAKFDFAHFWEDICFKNGPLVIPSVFEEKVGPHYRKITNLLHEYGINIVSLDCDGMIDSLIPTWFNNGVNTMFPIEVGTWNASIKPWREKYGEELRGIGGMDKRVFAADYSAVDAEIERLKPLVELGGYIPCPDHRIAPDAKWENVQYYCERMRKNF